MKRRDLLNAGFWVTSLIRGQTTQPVPGSASANEQGLALLLHMQTALGGGDRLAAILDLDWTVIAKSWNASGSWT